MNKIKKHLGRKAQDREFEVLYTLYHHETLARNEIAHHIHFPECMWLETTLDDLECINLVESQGRWIWQITEKGKDLMREELQRLSVWYVYKAYLITTTTAKINIFDAAEDFHNLMEDGLLKDFER